MPANRKFKKYKDPKEQQIRLQRSYLAQTTEKWNVRLGFHGKSKHFGCFDDLELAVLVAEEARDKYCGDFSGNERSTYANLSKEM